MTLNILYGTLEKARISSQYFLRSLSTTNLSEELLKSTNGVFHGNHQSSTKTNLHHPQRISNFQIQNTQKRFCFKEKDIKNKIPEQSNSNDNSEKNDHSGSSISSKEQKLPLTKDVEIKNFKKSEVLNSTYVKPRQNRSRQNLVWEKSLPNKSNTSQIEDKIMKESKRNVEIDKFANSAQGLSSPGLDKNNEPKSHIKLLNSKHKDDANESDVDPQSRSPKSSLKKNILNIEIVPNSTESLQSSQFKKITENSDLWSNTKNVFPIDDNNKSISLKHKGSVTNNRGNYEIMKDNIKRTTSNIKKINRMITTQSNTDSVDMDRKKGIGPSFKTSRTINEKDVTNGNKKNAVQKRPGSEILKEIEDSTNKSDNHDGRNPIQLLKPEVLIKAENVLSCKSKSLISSKRNNQTTLKEPDTKRNLKDKISLYSKNINLNIRKKSATSINKLLKPILYKTKPRTKKNEFRILKKELTSMTAPSDFLKENIKELVVNAKLSSLQTDESYTNFKSTIHSSLINDASIILKGINNKTNVDIIDKKQLQKKLSFTNIKKKEQTVGLKSKIKRWQMYNKLKKITEESTSKLYKSIMNIRRTKNIKDNRYSSSKKRNRKQTVLISIPIKSCSEANSLFNKSIHTEIKPDRSMKNSYNPKSKPDPTEILHNKYIKNREKNFKRSFKDVLHKQRSMTFKAKINKIKVPTVSRLQETSTDNSCKEKRGTECTEGNDSIQKLDPEIEGKELSFNSPKEQKKITEKNKLNTLSFYDLVKGDEEANLLNDDKICSYPSGCLKKPELIIQFSSPEKNALMMGFNTLLEDHNEKNSSKDKGADFKINKDKEEIESCQISEIKDETHDPHQKLNGIIRSLETELEAIKKEQLKKINGNTNQIETHFTQISPQPIESKDPYKLSVYPLEPHCVSIEIENGRGDKAGLKEYQGKNKRIIVKFGSNENHKNQGNTRSLFNRLNEEIDSEQKQEQLGRNEFSHTINEMSQSGDNSHIHLSSPEKALINKEIETASTQKPSQLRSLIIECPQNTTHNSNSIWLEPTIISPKQEQLPDSVTNYKPEKRSQSNLTSIPQLDSTNNEDISPTDQQLTESFLSNNEKNLKSVENIDDGKMNQSLNDSSKTEVKLGNGEFIIVNGLKKSDKINEKEQDKLLNEKNLNQVNILNQCINSGKKVTEKNEISLKESNFFFYSNRNFELINSFKHIFSNIFNYLKKGKNAIQEPIGRQHPDVINDLFFKRKYHFFPIFKNFPRQLKNQEKVPQEVKSICIKKYVSDNYISDKKKKTSPVIMLSNKKLKLEERNTEITLNDSCKNFNAETSHIENILGPSKEKYQPGVFRKSTEKEIHPVNNRIKQLRSFSDFKKIEDNFTKFGKLYNLCENELTKKNTEKEIVVNQNSRKGYKQYSRIKEVKTAINTGIPIIHKKNNTKQRKVIKKSRRGRDLSDSEEKLVQTKNLDYLKRKPMMMNENLHPESCWLEYDPEKICSDGKKMKNHVLLKNIKKRYTIKKKH